MKRRRDQDEVGPRQFNAGSRHRAQSPVIPESDWDYGPPAALYRQETKEYVLLNASRKAREPVEKYIQHVCELCGSQASCEWKKSDNGICGCGERLIVTDQSGPKAGVTRLAFFCDANCANYFVHGPSGVESDDEAYFWMSQQDWDGV